jgi:signal transduction histidine kinase
MAEAAKPASSLRREPAYRPAMFDQVMQAIVTGVVLLTLAVYAVAPWLAYAWSQRPFLGAFTENTDVFNDVRSEGANAWPAFQQGVRPRDQLLAIDGLPIPNSASLGMVLSQRALGQAVTLTIGREQPGAPDEQLTLRVTLQAFTLRDLFVYFIVPYGIGLSYLVLGLYVFWQRRGQVSGRIFALFCATTAVLIGGTFDLWTTHLLTWAWILAIPAGGASLFTLGLVFPQEVRLVQRWPAIRLVTFLPIILLSGYALYTVYNPAVDPRAYILAWRYQYYYMGAGILGFFGVVVYRALSSRSPIARDQSFIILLGAVVAFSPALIWAILPLFGRSVPFDVLFFLLPAVVFPVAVTYALLRYRLLEVDTAMKQVLAYAGVGALAILAYGLIVTGLSLLTGTALRATDPLLLGLYVFAFTLALAPLRDRMQRAIDRAFYRGQPASTRQLEQFGRMLTRAVALNDVVSALRRELESVLQPAHVHLFLRDPAENDFAAYHESGQPSPTDLRFAANGALATLLARERSALYLSPETPLPSPLLPDRARLLLLGSAVYAPLPGQTGLTGWLAVGPKLSGQAFSREDLRFVEALTDQAALAIERATGITDLERRVRELNVLSQMSQAVNFTLSFDDLLELIYAQATRIADTRNFYITLKEARGDALSHVFYVENNERVPAEENKPWPVGRGLATEILRTGQPIRADDYLAECRRRNIIPRPRPFKAWMGVPLNVGAETIGVMSVASFTPDQTFTDQELKVFWAIADQAASAIVRARLFQQIELRARQLASLNEVSANMASTLELDPLLKGIINSSVEILACEAGSLFLVDEEKDEYVFNVAVGPVGQDLVGMRIKRGKGFVGEAVESGAALIVNDVQNDPRWFKGSDESTGFQTRALMVVPLRRGERRIGAIEVINKRDGTPFGEEDKGLLTAFAGQAAVAIENARLFQQTDKALAERVDELQVMQRIDRELNTALDVQRVMSLTLAWAMRNTHAAAGSVGVVVENGLSIITTQGYTPEQERRRENPLPLAGWWGQVVTTGEVSLVRDAATHPAHRGLRRSTQVQLTIPIKRERQVMGVLNLESDDPDAFPEGQVDFVTRLVDHASIAITNARLYAEVQAANLAKSELMDFVAHELKNPMQPIKGFADLILGGAAGPINDTQKQFLGTIRNNVERLSAIVKDLNDSASLEAGKLRLSPKRLPLPAMVEDVVHAAKAALEAKQQTLSLDLPSDLPPVWVDYNRTVQILNNLLSNANKYTPEGGSIHLRVARADNEWDPDGAPEVLHVSVQDTGVGISPEDQKKLFQKFFRAEDTVARDMAPGTGLGLSIVKNLVELQGGKIWFESEFRKGSTFHFTVPLAPPETETVLTTG